MKKAFIFSFISYFVYFSLFYLFLGNVLEGFYLIIGLVLGQIFLIPVFKEVNYQSGTKISVKWLWSKKVFFEI